MELGRPLVAASRRLSLEGTDHPVEKTVTHIGDGFIVDRLDGVGFGVPCLVPPLLEEAAEAGEHYHLQVSNQRQSEPRRAPEQLGETWRW